MVSTPPASPSTHVPNPFPDPNWTNFLEDDVLTPHLGAKRSRDDLPDHPLYFEPDLFCPEDSLADTLDPVSSADNTLDMPSSPLLDFPHSLPPPPAPSGSWSASDAHSYSPPRWRSFMDQDCPLRRRVKVTITRAQTKGQGAKGGRTEGLDGVKAQKRDWMWVTKGAGENGAIRRAGKRCGTGKRRKGVSTGRGTGSRKPGVRRGRFGSGMMLYFGEMEDMFREEKAEEDGQADYGSAAGRRKRSRLSCGYSNRYLQPGLGAGSSSKRPTNYLDLFDDSYYQSSEVDVSTGQIMVKLQPASTHAQRKPSTFAKRFAVAARHGHISGALRVRLNALMTQVTCEEVLESHFEHRTATKETRVLPEFESAVRAVEDAATNYSLMLGKRPQIGEEAREQEQTTNLDKEKGKEMRHVGEVQQSKEKRTEDEADELDMDPASSALQKYLQSPVRHVGGRHRVVAP